MRQKNKFVSLIIVIGIPFTCLTLGLGILLALSPTAQASPLFSAATLRQQYDLSPAAALPPGQAQITSTVGLTEPTLSSIMGPVFQVSMSEPEPLPEWVQALKNGSSSDQISTAASELSASQSVEIASDPNNQSVFNGEAISYTIIITNNSTTDMATNILLFESLPENIQDSDVSNCGGCSRSQPVTISFFGPGISGVETITFTDAITWLIPSLAPEAMIQRSFVLTVACKAKDIQLKTQSFLNYQQGGGPGTSLSPELAATVRLPSFTEPGLIDQPSWCGDDVRGVFDLDWGDYDHDGDMDLVMASSSVSIGTVVIRNDAGELRRFWNSEVSVFGARWANLDADADLEIISVGSFPNAVYDLQGDEFVEKSTFTGQNGDQLFRVDVGNFDTDAAIEAVVSTNFLNSPCGVQLFENDGNGTLSFDTCIQANNTSAILDPADFDNDGDLDLVVHQFNSPTTGTLQIFLNNGTGSFPNNVEVEATTTNPPYDFAWGDFDGDGFLDLAGAFQKFSFSNLDDQGIQIYRNNNGTGVGSVDTIPVVTALTFGKPIALDWADFTGDGRLELAVDDSPVPRILQYNFGPDDFSELDTLPVDFFDATDNLWRIRAFDQDNDGDLDLSFSNTGKPAYLFENVSPLLEPTLVGIDNFKANGVAWGDVDNNGSLDLLFAAGQAGAEPGSRIYTNDGGDFPDPPGKLTASGFGPHAAAFGDVDGNGQLDVAVVTLSQFQLYKNGNTGTPDWSFSSAQTGRSVAWADVDLDNNGRLDLLVGTSGRNMLFLNSGLQAATSTPVWQSPETDDTRSVAWGYFDGDFFLDFAAGNNGGPVRVYRNNGDLTFSIAWNAPVSESTHSVAWGDYDGDGDIDLAVGNNGQANRIYANNNGTLTSVWDSGDTSPTTGVAWGDWDNDRDLDLAVGNRGAQDQVFVNQGLEAGVPVFDPVWESTDPQQTTGVAWGDLDHDGDLDLAISQDGSGQNGVYLNSYVTPSHLTDQYTQTMPLPHNPSYVAMARPGQTKDAYFFSSGELFTINQPLDPPTPTFVISIPFRVYDPDGTRAGTNTNAQGDPIAAVRYQYSLDGGTNWQPATLASTDYDSTTHRLGHPNNPPGFWTFGWDAGQDLDNPSEVVNDDVRFRITVVHQNNAGPVQRSQTTGVSPPFRIRRLECVWPDAAAITVQPPLTSRIPIKFEGSVLEADGAVTFNWDFGDGTPGQLTQGQIIHHTYNSAGTYTVTLKVIGPSCPVAREAIASTQVTISQNLANTIYLPIIMKQSNGTQPTAVESPSEKPQLELFSLNVSPESPGQVTGLTGNTQRKTGVTRLVWSANPASDNVIGYRVHRATVATTAYQRLADLPVNVTAYTDDSTPCGQMYLVTAYNDAGESLPSTSTYFSPPCR